ncbi:type IV secretory system conjugative DNA transfer family protein [Arsenophonus nasoniae]|uniref:Type IV secretory system conjugative DNA transfer family protein n=1 Tax=Arsenophonus nasoniae TaxID=638 RepID=A0ABY8NWI2_9GAMM|nr:type IV secretory system conjugative DNA transfer family protein [Arsenophonus nasoniae]WGM08747.1 type IV secretory system conjugative DNA transfer family protein [Arsenophonus nasoniae]
MKNIKNGVFIKTDFVSMGAFTRAGKGAGIVIPNLLAFNDSMIVLDMKGEHKKTKKHFDNDLFLV